MGWHNIVEGKLTFSDKLAGVMGKTTHSPARRRKPTQVRAQATVDAMLDAVVRLLKRRDASSITTNHIAEAAGVSIGSVYQYFPNKRAIFVALHERHIREVDRVIQCRIRESAGESLDSLVSSLIDGMIELHAADPELSVLLDSEVPHRADGTREFSFRLQDHFRTALAPHAKSLGGTTKLDVRAFLLGNMVDAFGHALVLRRPPGLSLRGARGEVCRAILACLK
jgi:AcrR family transcriptional regulator